MTSNRCRMSMEPTVHSAPWYNAERAEAARFAVLASLFFLTGRNGACGGGRQGWRGGFGRGCGAS